MCPSCKEGKWYPMLLQAVCCQQVKEGDPPFLFSSAEPGLFCSVLIFPVQEGQEHTERATKVKEELELLSHERQREL